MPIYSYLCTMKILVVDDEQDTDVGTHDDTDTLSQCHQSGIDKTYHHHRRGTRRLNECCDIN